MDLSSRDVDDMCKFSVWTSIVHSIQTCGVFSGHAGRDGHSMLSISKYDIKCACSTRQLHLLPRATARPGCNRWKILEDMVNIPTMLVEFLYVYQKAEVTFVFKES